MRHGNRVGLCLDFVCVKRIFQGHITKENSGNLNKLLHILDIQVMLGFEIK